MAGRITSWRARRRQARIERAARIAASPEGTRRRRGPSPGTVAELAAAGCAVVGAYQQWGAPAAWGVAAVALGLVSVADGIDPGGPKA